ncbi:hypothetical protein BXZ70DRAFT_1076735 [Cristinia sonorae]|uniref:Uncharacterized protein n=1 Tax=Cristinia sonorae TaxID=1940300 RepID=A0A8K0USG0_9AGAR|nr:hypothetical protein BXZ70DRAFT_1076735 [Cristinia sonorae]
MSYHAQNVPVSGYSSISGAVPPIFTGPRAILPANRVLLPQPTWTSSGLGKADGGKSAHHIAFDMEGSHDGFGISLLDVASRGNLNGWMKRANDLLGLNTDKIYLRLVWPGYEHIDFNRAIPINSQTTRGALAAQIAKLIMTYISRITSETPNPAGAKWRVGAGNVNLEHIYLISAFCMQANTFQVVLQLQFR